MLHASAHICQLTSLTSLVARPVTHVQRPLQNALHKLPGRRPRHAATAAAWVSRRRSCLPCCAAAPVASDASPQQLTEQPEEDEESDEEEEESSDEEGDAAFETAAAQFADLTEEELAAQDEAFRQDVLTSDMLEADAPGHVAGYVALVGRPNAGKSSLLNALLGQKLSAVTQKAQTTRHRILGIVSEADYQLILLDTPGVIRDVQTKLDEKMMHNVNTAVQQADAILVIIDATEGPSEVLKMPGMAPGWTGPPAAVVADDISRLPPMRAELVLNKTDRLLPKEVDQAIKWLQDNTAATAVLPTATVSGDGIGAVLDWGVKQLPQGPTLYPKDSVSEQSERFFVAEIVREKIFLQYHQEIPYCTAVQVTEFKERASSKDYVQVSIMVESDSQRPILLGRQGAAIKQLSTQSRLAIEEFLDREVYLDLSVKVVPKWRRNNEVLEQYGY